MSETIEAVAIAALREIAQAEMMVEGNLGEGLATKALAKIAGMRVEQSVKAVHDLGAQDLTVDAPGLKP
jgi:hypothetical protein